MDDGRQAGTERRRTPVQAAIAAARDKETPLTAAARFCDVPVTSTQRPAGVDLFGVERLDLREAAASALPPRCESARDRAWDAAVQSDPALFDGPVVSRPRGAGAGRGVGDGGGFAGVAALGHDPGEYGSVGLTHVAPALSEAALREGFATAASAERARGRAPELDGPALGCSPAELDGLSGPHAGCPEPVISRYASHRAR